LTVPTSFAQGLLVDQATGGSVTQGNNIQNGGQLAQSFSPLLSAVGFVQFNEFVPAFPGNDEVIFMVNLRAGAYNGPVLGSTDPVVLVNHGTQIGTFYFPDNIPVTPNQVYYFEPVVQSAGRLFIGETVDSAYTRGDLFSNGAPSGGAVDIWFQEGVVVPEPATVWLLLFGLGAFCCRWRGGRRS
jgi:hypothetical protein